MKGRDSSPPTLKQSTTFTRGVRLMTLAGIQIRLDASLIIIFTLLVYLLGASIFPEWHPDWGAGTLWLTAVAAGVLFFTSLLLHELAHALVARHFGIPVPRITLFLFGGLAEIQEEPGSPRTEFLIAIAGPATSLALGLFFTYLAGGLADPGIAELFSAQPQAALAELSPLATLLLWLGPINILLGLFNLVPGFPLDGGRVLRALIWWITGDLYRATQVASGAGQMFGWCLMVLGFMQVLSGFILQGLWMLMIGWFLANAASASYRQLVMREMFKGITVRDLMRSRFEEVDEALYVSDFVENHLLQSPQMLWPVTTDNGQLIGLVTIAEIQRIPAQERQVVRIGQIMRTDLSELTLGPGTNASQAIASLGIHHSPLAVVENDRVIGLLSQFDVMKWLVLHRKPGR